MENKFVEFRGGVADGARFDYDLPCDPPVVVFVSYNVMVPFPDKLNISLDNHDGATRYQLDSISQNSVIYVETQLFQQKWGNRSLSVVEETYG